MITVLGGISKLRMAEILGLRVPHKTYSKVRKLNGLSLHRIVKVEIVEKDSLLYDIEVPETHTFAISGGLILTHNSTIHAETVEAAVKRLTSPPMNIPEGYIPLMNIAMIIKRIRLKKPGEEIERIVRKITDIYEIWDYGKYVQIMKWNPFKDEFTINLERSKVLDSISEITGKTVSELLEEIERRSKVLEWMALKDIRKYDKVAEVVRKYYANPEEVYKRAIRDLEAV